jgi:hypothetical protein
VLVLRTGARRLSQAELAARISAAPSFVADRVPGDELDQMCAGYEAITGVRITTQRKRAFVAAVYPGSTDEPRLRGAETTNQVPI